MIAMQSQAALKGMVTAGLHFANKFSIQRTLGAI
jgi:hypothetical protein